MKTSIYKPLAVNSEKGVALIIALGILAILAILGTSFAINMRLEQKASANYRDMVKATYIAEMGIAKAMRELRNELSDTHLKGNFDSFNDGWAGSGWDKTNIVLNVNRVTDEPIETGEFTLKILDAAARIYINDEKNPKLAHILNTLGEVVDGTNEDEEYGKDNDRPILPGDGEEIVKYLKDTLGTERGFRTEEEIRLAPDTLISTNRNAYVAIEDFITANTVVNPDAGADRAPVNINTAFPEVLMTVIGGITGLSPTDNDTIAAVAAIMQYRDNKTWVYHDDGDDAQSWEWDEEIGCDEESDGKPHGHLVDPNKDAKDGVQGKPNPFDGWDSNRGDEINLDPVVGFIGPLGQEYSYSNPAHYLFENDWLDVDNSGGFPDDDEKMDNNGDGTANTGSDGRDNDEDGYTDEEDEYADSHIFAGGARGEFEALINQLAAGGYGYDEDGNPLKINLPGIDQPGVAQDIVRNADPLFGADTTEFSFRSRNFIIFSTGTLSRNGKPVAKRSIMRIIQR